MSYRVVYIEKAEYLQLYLDNIKIDWNSQSLTIPIKDILILIIDNVRSSLSVPLINKLAAYNVCTVICGVDHMPATYIHPINGHFSQSLNIMKQIEWDENIKELLHQKIIKNKIRNQRIILEKNHRDKEVIQKLNEYENQVNIDDTSNREGLASKIYFKELFGIDFIRFEDDIINHGLNYGYHIFRTLISSIIISKGYLSNIGLFHRGRENLFNLSDDIIEVFRPIVDDYVYNHLRKEVLFKQVYKDELISLTLKKVEIDNKKQTIANAIHIYIEHILNELYQTGEFIPINIKIDEL